MDDNEFIIAKLRLAWDIAKEGRRNSPANVDGYLNSLRKAHQHINETVENPQAPVDDNNRQGR